MRAMSSSTLEHLKVLNSARPSRHREFATRFVIDNSGGSYALGGSKCIGPGYPPLLYTPGSLLLKYGQVVSRRRMHCI